MAEIIRGRDHRCLSVIGQWPHHGTIMRCECGQVWRAVEPGNPEYASWRRIGRLELRIRLWLAERRSS